MHTDAQRVAVLGGLLDISAPPFSFPEQLSLEQDEENLYLILNICPYFTFYIIHYIFLELHCLIWTVWHPPTPSPPLSLTTSMDLEPTSTFGNSASRLIWLSSNWQCSTNILKHSTVVVCLFVRNGLDSGFFSMHDCLLLILHKRTRFLTLLQNPFHLANWLMLFLQDL